MRGNVRSFRRRMEPLRIKKSRASLRCCVACVPFTVLRARAAHVMPLRPISGGCRHQFSKQPQPSGGAGQTRFSVEECHSVALTMYDFLKGRFGPRRAGLIAKRRCPGLGTDELVHEERGTRCHDQVRQHLQDEYRHSLQHGRTP